MGNGLSNIMGHWNFKLLPITEIGLRSKNLGRNTLSGYMIIYLHVAPFLYQEISSYTKKKQHEHIIKPCSQANSGHRYYFIMQRNKEKSLLKPSSKPKSCKNDFFQKQKY